ncbi:MAG: UTP--glucose-1-phosphate uridylyltransferase GalU [Clostridia bacterium]|nr:UTP--glucose-1-phosphate uridylyltransferase GalU [Clostridia bacterium]
MTIKKAIIPAAGFGTRFLPATKVLPKAMLPIVDKPAVHYLVEEAIASGVEEIIIVTGQDKKLFENYFSKSKELEKKLAKAGKWELLEEIKKISYMADISYVAQKQPLGLGHAIYSARKFISKDDAFAVLLGDDIVFSKEPCLAQLRKILLSHQANIIGVQSVPDSEVSYYGIVKGEKLAENLIKVEDLVEKPDIKTAPSNLAILGRYIIHSDIFAVLENTSPGVGGEIQLTDALRELNKTQEIYAYVFEGTRYDAGDKLGYLKATIEFALQKKELSKEFKEYLTNLSRQGFILK